MYLCVPNGYVILTKTYLSVAPMYTTEYEHDHDKADCKGNTLCGYYTFLMTFRYQSNPPSAEPKRFERVAC